jgi:biotin transport system substrate-specific component
VQAAITGLPLGATALTSLAFLPGDLIKVALGTVLTLALWKAYPPVFGRVRERRRVAATS